MIQLLLNTLGGSKPIYDAHIFCGSANDGCIGCHMYRFKVDNKLSCSNIIHMLGIDLSLSLTDGIYEVFKVVNKEKYLGFWKL